MDLAPEPTASDFVQAFRVIGLVHDNHVAMLRCHAQSPGRTRTATQIAEAVGYNGYRAVNLQYGLLAARVGEALGRHQADLSLLVEFASPDSHGNACWELILRPAVAQAVAEMGWM